MDPCTIVTNVRSIFSLPDVVFRINDLIDSEEATNTELERIISSDPALTAKLLKFANSTYFGFSGKIETVMKAISIIGHQELRNLVIASSVTTTFKGIPPDLVNMDTFWNHSVTSGVTARLLASSVDSRERFFIAGLLHDVGRLILFSQFPKESAKVLNCLNQGEDVAMQEERKIFGFTHAQLGAELLKQWKLPLNIWKMVEYQSDPMRSGEYQSDANTLCAAISIANYIQPCTNQPLNLETVISDHALKTWSYLGLTAEIVESVITVAKLQVIEVFNAIH
ncbi:HDOD domain-containing protein [Nitrosomonas ureae]|uniref:HD-like signal output (HDOD) domain, no enzymatic activity n=1 Tax=Nitrosomonas ureae TaxID=44577 RepID=A0A0S3AH75_9PROT|nr:HDOD domain-containing protein [Nitrosomonas ureae]ALQ50390.1 phosphohydrolase [Nitrosomonas ureae]PTQ87474.1 HD-like signal output (HDOD) protein [Nitrosomonas ureae]PXX17142.1 HD-like signal output (HDOD) protein [Nitrosomonas ureae]SDT87516.1 HD-like signal output (HDOD) domain, no enzymatic activity [Nitrosomonas ureae]SEP64341.1 HD-like signal output (HDOD) domain, no enzymatic activity [Nitrosomonas ureae]